MRQRRKSQAIGAGVGLESAGGDVVSHIDSQGYQQLYSSVRAHAFGKPNVLACQCMFLGVKSVELSGSSASLNKRGLAREPFRSIHV